MVKDTMKRKKPSFNEEYHGYRTFSELLEDAAANGLIEHRAAQGERDLRRDPVRLGAKDAGPSRAASRSARPRADGRRPARPGPPRGRRVRGPRVGRPRPPAAASRSGSSPGRFQTPATAWSTSSEDRSDDA